MEVNYFRIANMLATCSGFNEALLSKLLFKCQAINTFSYLMRLKIIIAVVGVFGAIDIRERPLPRDISGPRPYSLGCRSKMHYEEKLNLDEDLSVN